MHESNKNLEKHCEGETEKHCEGETEKH